ncbi:MAG: hypothetical protein AABW52_06405 [Nanoarchaeota archaeon]
MEKTEYELWKKFDIYGYTSMVRIFIESPKNIKKYYDKKKPDIVNRELKKLKETCENFGRRIDRIDIEKYDKRFPLKVIESLKKRVHNALKELPIKTSKDLENGNFRESITYAQEEGKYMLELKNEVYANYPKYSEYRSLTPEDERKRDS